MTKKQKHRIIQGIWILLLALVLVLVGLKVFVKGQQYFKDKHMKTAAIDYIREKYGVEAVFENLYYYYYYKPELAYVKLKDGDKEFQVYIDTENETESFSDTYQYDEICDAFTEYIDETYPECKYNDIKIWGSSPFELLFRKLSLDQDTRFDGSNLHELLKDCQIKFTIYYVETEFTDCELFRELQERDVDAAFVSFDTKEHLDEFLDRRVSNISLNFNMQKKALYYADDVYYAPHITQIWKIDEGKSISTNYQLEDGDGFLYCCPAAPVSFHEINAENLAYCLAYNFYGVKKEEVESILERVASKAYEFNSTGWDWDPIYVYIPISEIPDYENLGAFWSARSMKNTGQIVDGIYALTRYGDYAVFTLNAGLDPSWMLTIE